MAEAERRTILRTDAVSELLDELQLLGTGADAAPAWIAVWEAVSAARATRQSLEARAARPAPRGTTCLCPQGPRLPDGTWAPYDLCPIHNGPCECGAPRRADGTLSCAR